VVIVGDHDLYHRSQPETHQRENSCTGVAKVNMLLPCISSYPVLFAYVCK